MKTLLAAFAVAVLFMVSPAMACDSAGSAEDCGWPGDEAWVRFSWPSGDGVICDINGCSSSWLRSLPDVPLPTPDFPEPVGDLPPSNDLLKKQ